MKQFIKIFSVMLSILVALPALVQDKVYFNRTEKVSTAIVNWTFVANENSPLSVVSLSLPVVGSIRP